MSVQLFSSVVIEPTVSGHFIQRPFRTKETISYNNTGVTLYKDFLYENIFSTIKLGPYLCLLLSIVQSIKKQTTFPNQNTLSVIMVEPNDIK